MCVYIYNIYMIDSVYGAGCVALAQHGPYQCTIMHACWWFQLTSHVRTHGKKKKKIRHHARPRRASATAPLRIGADIVHNSLIK